MTDTIVLGAGAAGLAAAAELQRAGRQVVVLEARDRAGGRILSRAGAPPQELGAEFIHGDAPATRALVVRAGSAAVDAPRSHWMMQGGRLAPMRDTFADVERALRHRGRSRRDTSFEALLEALERHGVARRTRDFARMLVEGFDAADPKLASARAIVEEWSGGSAADSPTYRPLGGYGPLVDVLSRDLDDVRLGHVVHAVHWRRGRVTVEGATPSGSSFRLTARRVLVALPLGVLQAPIGATGGVRFAPSLASKARALEHLGSGPVVKLVIRFHEPFWERLQAGRFRDAAFFHEPRAPFPTFWTALPLRSSVLVAWAGGPRASRLAGARSEDVVRQALASLHAIFGTRVRVESLLAGTDWHDWTADPFARGAYSFVKVGGHAARGQLAAPLLGTLFFAGEAADADGGTVEAALRSGIRAAKQALSADG